MRVPSVLKEETSTGTCAGTVCQTEEVCADFDETLVDALAVTCGGGADAAALASGIKGVLGVAALACAVKGVLGVAALASGANSVFGVEALASGV